MYFYSIVSPQTKYLQTIDDRRKRKDVPILDGKISPMCASPLNGMPPLYLYLPFSMILSCPEPEVTKGMSLCLGEKSVLHPSSTEKEMLLLSNTFELLLFCLSSGHCFLTAYIYIKIK